jgi:photosystem II stability/assembly factor-like uncharacterized protein
MIKFNFIKSKKLFAVLGIIIFSLMALSASAATIWTKQNSGISEDLNGVYFVDANTGWAVGKHGKDTGVILKTTNGGTTWVIQNNDKEKSKNLNGVYFVDANTGWAVGDYKQDSGVILKTTNGGTTWVVQDIDKNKHISLEGVYFVDANTGWAVGDHNGKDSGVILKTTNGGTDWVIQDIDKNKHIKLYGVYFVDANTGWAVGDHNGKDSGVILKTTNGGTDWVIQDIDKNKHIKLYGVYFVDANTGWAVGDSGKNSGVILKTTNGGTTWVVQDADATKDSKLNAVYFTDANTGWAVGLKGIDTGVILKTTNGGTDWVADNPNVKSDLRGISFADANTGWIVGSMGVILKYFVPTLSVSLSANPNSGTNPLTGVDLTASVGGTATGNTVYKFDCNNDGTFEHTSAAIAQTTYTATGLCTYSDPGLYTAKVEADRGGLVATDTTTITVTQRTISVALNASPNTGTNPLDSNLTATVGGNAIGDITYKFDCTNDGTFEYTSSPTSQTSYTSPCTYSDAGNYTAKVVATRQGLTAESTVNISVIQRTLNVSLSASPNAGDTPLKGVDLTASVSGNATGNMVYKFDCDNDGTFEYISPSTSQTTYTAASLCSYTTIGFNTASVTVARQGLTATNTVSITVTPQPTLTVLLSANPTTGVAPLNNVSLTSSVGGTATGNIVYKFDCTNNGTFEHVSSPTSQTTYTIANICSYDTAGTYTVSVMAERQGINAINTTSISVAQPTLSVSLVASPDNGTNPLDSDLTASVGGTATGNIVYKFDCDSDGTYEFTSSPTTQAAYSYLCTYNLPNIYTAKAVVERQGLTANNTADITVTQRVLNVSLSANPNSGIEPLTGVDLTGLISGNATGNIVYKFDCTNDGTFEYTSAPTSQESYTATDVCSYNTTGIYTAKVEVSRQGLTAINTVVITVAPTPTLNVSLTATPNAGTNPLENVDLKASVSGTATGNIVYKFDCTNDGTFERTSDATSQTTYTAANVCTYNTAGTYTASIVATRGGITAIGTTNITVAQRDLTVSLSADPNTGTNPIENVSFTANVGGNATGNIVYKFDCTNDGTFEHTSAATSKTTYTATNVCTYDAAGTYTASVTVERQGLTSQETTNIIAIQRTLAVSLTASPNSGIAPLNGVDLSASVSGNATGNIVYKFDCTNDGTFEHTSAATSQTTYTATDACSYDTVGSYTAKVIAERQGISTINTVSVTVIPAETALTASLNATPNSGIAPLIGVGFQVALSGTATGNITYKVDCTGDGTFERTSDQILTNPYTFSNICDYGQPGTYTARVEVARSLSNEEGAQVVTQSATANIVVSPQPLVITTSARLVDTAAVNQFYTTTINATGGLGAKTFSITSGSMPTGLSLNADGTISGTPVADGTFNFVVAVSDTQPTITEKIFTLFIAPAPTAEVPKTNIVVTPSVDPDTSGSATLINANNTEIKLSVDSGTVPSDVDSYSIVISSLNNTSSDFVPIPSGTGNAVASIIYEADLINNTTAQKVTGFNKPVTITISYLDSDLPSGTDETKLKINFYNEATAQWEALDTTVDTSANIATATIPHLTRFALVAAAAPIIFPSLPQIPSGGSGYTPTITPSITAPKTCSDKVDFNKDGKVNLVDFSILDYWYKKLKPSARFDLNGDNKVDLTEFSILIYCWTK